MTKPLQYKGYLGVYEIDPDEGIIHGEVIGIRDVVTFEGESVRELQEAFRTSVDDYLAFCTKLGRPPEKPFSGQFVTRLSPDIHRMVSMAAAAAGLSLNSWVALSLRAAAEASLADRGRDGAETEQSARAPSRATGRGRGSRAKGP